MKHFKNFLSLAVCAALLLGCFGCARPTVDTPTVPKFTVPAIDTPPTEVAQLEARAAYADAAEKLNALSDLTLTVQISRETTVGSEIFHESSTQTLSYKGLGTNALQASSLDNLDYAGYSATIEEFYADGTMYVFPGGAANATCSFSEDMSADEFAARYVPSVALDAALYEQIALQPTDSGFAVSFTAPSALESWAAPDGAALKSACGTAQMDKKGGITDYTYTASYTYGPVAVTVAAEISINAKNAASVVLPQNASSSLPLEFADAPRMIDQAVGFLTQSQTFSSRTAESIMSQAAGVIRNESADILSYGSAGEYMSELDYSLYIMDYSQDPNGESTSYEQVEHFQDGKYTITIDDGDPTADTSVTAEDIQDYLDDYLLDNLFSPGSLAAASGTDLGGTYLFEFTYTPEQGQSLSHYICSILFKNENLLDNLASAYETTVAEGYLAIDKYTGLPTAVGVNYEGAHTIEGDRYLLTLQTDQAINLASLSTYEGITEEPLPRDEPTEKATPLFYHVTGENGQEMWLLGTIHVGDVRTSYLPQEIYDAFQSADALAVEFDTNAFSERAKDDEALQALMSQAYYYSDGTTTADHLDAELYEYALMLLKASGNYNFNAPYMKPNAWSNSIDNFFIQQGYLLTSEDGVDSRLLALAENTGKEIRDIESGEFQIQMLMGYSDTVQEALLGSSVSSDPAESWQSTLELFEAWCRGDEAELRELMTNDYSDMSEEELAVYNEYNTAMLIDRNTGMLEVAKSYLESGDIVFYAVGLAHLLSGNGLVDALRDAGYTVELVSYGF